jgi:hypothetical protein
LTFPFLGSQACFFLNTLALCGSLKTLPFHSLTLSLGALTRFFFGL